MSLFYLLAVTGLAGSALHTPPFKALIINFYFASVNNNIHYCMLSHTIYWLIDYSCKE